MFDKYTKVRKPGGGGGTQHMHIRYGEACPIFLGQNIAKSDIFGSRQIKYVHDLFYTKYHLKLIFPWFARACSIIFG